MKRAFLFLVGCMFFSFVAGAEEGAPKPAASVKELERLPGLYWVAGHGGVVGAVYLIKTAEPVLIDCGSRVGWNQLVGNLKLLGMSPGDIRWVIATHGHWDHMDAMTIFQKEYPNVKFAIHAGDAQFVISDDRVFSCAEPLYKGVPSGPVKVDRILLDGDTVDAGGTILRIVHTPGHTPGSIVILAEIVGKKIAFCGDSIGGYYALLNRSSVIDWQLSMNKMMKLDIDWVFPGHGGQPCTDKEEIRHRLQKSLEVATIKRKEQEKDEGYHDGGVPVPVKP